MTCGYPKVQTIAFAFVKALEMMTELCSNQYINDLCQLMNSPPVVSGGIESSSNVEIVVGFLTTLEGH